MEKKEKKEIVGFKDEYVLASGFPWTTDTEPCFSIAMCKEIRGVNFVRIKFRDEFWRLDCPKYELILRKVKKK